MTKNTYSTNNQQKVYQYQLFLFLPLIIFILNHFNKFTIFKSAPFIHFQHPALASQVLFSLFLALINSTVGFKKEVILSIISLNP